MPGKGRGGPRVGEVGEFPLIERLAARLGPLRDDVIAGIGDDVAILAAGPDHCLLATCDVQVAGSHFLPDRCDPRRLGRKCAAINLSDIASVGGRPTHFLCSLVLPAETDVAFLETLYEGLADEAGRYGADVVGGNLSRGTELVLDFTLLGEAARSQVIRREGARPGDRILVTGGLGAAAAGLHLHLEPDTVLEPGLAAAARDAFEIPTPRLRESGALVAAGGVTAMIDVSDGLSADLGHLCERSGVGVRLRLDAIPVSGAARAVAAAAGREALDWALGGGEDYELLFTAREEAAGALAEAVRRETGTPVTDLGQVVSAGEGRTLVDEEGREAPLSPEGWRHF